MKFVKMLERSNSKIAKDRAQRIGKQAERAYQTRINELQDKIDSVEDQIDGHVDLSTSNQTTTDNKISGTKFDSKEWVNTLCDLETKKEKLSLELQVIKDKVGPYFSDEKA